MNINVCISVSGSHELKYYIGHLENFSHSNCKEILRVCFPAPKSFVLFLIQEQLW